jgi:hypothetical protein
MKMLTEETPAKVVGLLGASLFSLVLLLGVSSTNASFQGTEVPFPDPANPANVMAMLQNDPFGPDNVVAFLDNVSSSYANAVHVAVTGPTHESFAYMNQTVSDDAAWIRNETDVDNEIVAMAGLSDLTWVESTPMARVAENSHPVQVASASTKVSVDKQAAPAQAVPVVAAAPAQPVTGKVAGAFTAQAVSAKVVKLNDLLLKVDAISSAQPSDGLLQCDGECQ